jgi:hypothetical protein
VAYGGDPALAGSGDDPMLGKRAGGVNVFGGGLGLYNRSHKVVGAVGVSGDTACRDHNIAWRVRNNIRLDNLTGVGGVFGDATHPDNMIFDAINGNKNTITDGFEHAKCPNTVSPLNLPAVK